MFNLKSPFKQQSMTIPTTMAAVYLTAHGGLDKLEYRTDVPVPRPGNTEVMYLLLWANFCAFCVSLLTSQNAELQLTSLLSDDLPVRALCVSRLRSLWTHMRNSLHVLDEGLAYLIQKCSEAIIRVSS